MQEESKISKSHQYSKGDKVIVLGGIIDTNGLVDSSVQIGIVEEVGLSDLLLDTSLTSISKTYHVISKSLCRPISIDSETLSKSQPLNPRIGDMVFFKGRVSWRDTEVSAIAGVVYEIAYAGGRPDKVKVLVDTEMKELDYNSLLVLQRAPEQADPTS